MTDETEHYTDGTERPTVSEIVSQAKRYEPALSTRQSQAFVAHQAGYSVKEMVELFGPVWGVTNETTEHNVLQALERAKDKFNSACRIVEDFNHTLQADTE